MQRGSEYTVPSFLLGGGNRFLFFVDHLVPKEPLASVKAQEMYARINFCYFRSQH